MVDINNDLQYKTKTESHRFQIVDKISEKGLSEISLSINFGLLISLIQLSLDVV